jgi:hypothetical protein
VARLNAQFDILFWLTLGELSRCWAARELTRVEVVEGAHTFRSPFACPGFTVSLPLRGAHVVEVVAGSPGVRTILTAVERRSRLAPGTFVRQETGVVACFDLPKGTAKVQGGP